MAPPVATMAQIQEQFEPVPAGPDASFDTPYGVMQTSLANSVQCHGVGLHSGADVSLTLRPAPANTGIVFYRIDIANQAEAAIPALFAHVCDATLCSVIGNNYRHTIGTVEHLMAALSGMGIDNAYIDIDGPEVPVMDGSARAFVDMIMRAGITQLDAPRLMIRITQPVRVEAGDRACELVPDDVCAFEADIDFDNPLIGRQSAEFILFDHAFREQLADARTFGMLHEVQAMHAAGLALGGSLDNAIVLDGEQVLNVEGLRSADEFVRHKLLDAVGDLYLAGLRIIGRYRGIKAGHALHNKLLHALFSRPDAFEIISLEKHANLVAAE